MQIYFIQNLQSTIPLINLVEQIITILLNLS